MYSARVPLIITEATCSGVTITQEMIDYWEHQSGISYDLVTVLDNEIQNLTDAFLRVILTAAYLVVKI